MSKPLDYDACKEIFMLLDSLRHEADDFELPAWPWAQMTGYEAP
jgi:hypothetical protein